MRRSRPGLRGAVAGGIVGALVAGGVGFAAGNIGSNDTVQTRVVQAAPEALADQALDLRTLLKRVSPSVVSIQLGQASSGQVVEFAAGSGVIISADGLVLTNAHVVDGADVIQVRLSDERTIRADLVGTSPSHDIALVPAAGRHEPHARQARLVRGHAGGRSGGGHRQRPRRSATPPR